MTTTTTQRFVATTDWSAAYAAADPSQKGTMRTEVRDAIVAAVMADDLAESQRLVAIQASFKASKPTAAPIDWTARLADRAATLRAALLAIESRQVTLPEGAECPTGPLPEGSADAAEVASLVTFAARKSQRGAVVPWIESVLGDEPMTIAEMTHAWVATADYPQGPPSTGAIGAALARVAKGAEADFEVIEVSGVTGAQRV